MSQTPFQATYPTGKTLQVTIPSTVSIAGNDYTFLQWENSSTDLTRNVTVNSDVTLTATYVQMPMQAGFPLWSLPFIAVGAIIVYAMERKDKKRKESS